MHGGVVLLFVTHSQFCINKTCIELLINMHTEQSVCIVSNKHRTHTRMHKRRENTHTALHTP